MRKILFLALIATLTLGSVSCTKKKIVEENVTNEIGFSSFLGNTAVTKGTIATTSNLTNFGVFADLGYTLTPNFMNNQLVTGSNGVWTYTPKKYWPNDETQTISFYAYAPHNGDGINFGDNYVGAPEINFIVNDDITKQIDLLIARPVQNVDKNSVKETGIENYGDDPFIAAVAEGKVPISLRHALSRVDIIVKADNAIDNATNIFLTGLTVSGFPATGTTNMITGYGTPWTSQAGSVSFELECEDTDAEGNVVATAVALPKTAYPAKGKYIPGSDVADSGYLMMIPKNNTELSLTVNYNVVTDDPNFEGGKVEFVEERTLTLKQDFVPGKAYVLKLNIKLDIIEFTASVEEWVDAPATPVDVK